MCIKVQLLPNNSLCSSAASPWTPCAPSFPLPRDISSTSAQRYSFSGYVDIQGSEINAKFKVLEFVDDHGNEVLNMGSFALLPLHVVRLILMREELKADEFSKFQVKPLLFSVLTIYNLRQPSCGARSMRTTQVSQ